MLQFMMNQRYKKIPRKMQREIKIAFKEENKLIKFNLSN